MPIDPATGEEKLNRYQWSYGRSKGHSLYDFTLESAGVDAETVLHNGMLTITQMQTG
jgi:hypothetical protein